MRIGEFCKRKRIEKNLNEEQVASLVGKHFQASLLWDFETADDDDIDGWSIHDLKKYCEVIGIKPIEIAEAPTSDLTNLSLSSLIRTRREEKGITIEDFSERIGYEVGVVEAIENGKRDVIVCIHALKGMAKELDISFKILLGLI